MQLEFDISYLGEPKFVFVYRENALRLTDPFIYCTFPSTEDNQLHLLQEWTLRKKALKARLTSENNVL
jgi:hypothetical protein